MTTVHQPVLGNEVVGLLQPKPGQTFIDGTIGGGGHSSSLLQQLQPGGRLVGFDHDADAIARVQQRFDGVYSPEQLIVIHDSFFHLGSYCVQHQLAGTVDGILLDLGMSSDQLEGSGRGFSFQRDTEPLDLRMDARRATTAAALLQHSSEADLLHIFKAYGEIPQAARLVRAIMARRLDRPIQTVADLKTAGHVVYPRLLARDLAPIWQALRIAVNNELEPLAQTLREALSILSPGGRLAVITFHSLEDRIVKHLFRDLTSTRCICPPEMPVCQCQRTAQYELITKHPIIPNPTELVQNPRARSAKLRVIQKH
jgi:16S rRNA (cytosine1402-N4)-methyltransferase